MTKLLKTEGSCVSPASTQRTTFSAPPATLYGGCVYLSGGLTVAKFVLFLFCDLIVCGFWT